MPWVPYVRDTQGTPRTSIERLGRLQLGRDVGPSQGVMVLASEARVTLGVAAGDAGHVPGMGKGVRRRGPPL